MCAISDSRIKVSVLPESTAVFAPVSVTVGVVVSIVVKLDWLLLDVPLTCLTATPTPYFSPSYPSMVHGAVASFIC
jgi:hypothetical protein